MIPTQIREIIAHLCAHRVAFVIVGGAAALLQGAPINTFDIDILYARDEENIERLLAALDAMDAIFRGDLANRRMKPNATHLRSLGHKLLHTKFGQLDVLGSIEEAMAYEDVLGDVKRLDLGGLEVQVLGLERLIEVKQKTGRAKDLAMLPVLRAVLERSRARGG